MDDAADTSISIVIAAELRLYRESLAQLLDADPRLHVVGTAASVDEALACTLAARPRVAIVDLRGAVGRDAIRALGETHVAPRVVALGVRETDAEVVALAEAGVAGYVTRDESLEDLVEVVVLAAKGELRCSPRIAAALLRRVAAARDHHEDAWEVQLTQRETQVMCLVDEGLSNKEIAQQLQIEHATVKNHVHNILEKLRASTRTEAAARLRRAGALRPLARD